MEFYPLEVKQIDQITKNAVAVTFSVPEKYNAKFKYKSGQYLTVKKEINGEALRRMYSLCDKPRSGKLKVGIKKVKGGKFSTFANEHLKVGDIIEVAPAKGKFTIEFRSNNNRKYALIAAGSGITPILSLSESILSEEPFSTVDLFFGNQTPSTVMFSKEIEHLLKIYPKRFRLFSKFSKSEDALEKGRITPEWISDKIGIDKIKDIYGYYICGPEQMITDIKEFMLDKGLDKHQIHFELFSSTATISDTQIPIDADGPPAEVSITIHGKTHHIQVPFGAKILDVGLNEGLELPYSCRGGICASCEARVTHGEVEVVKNMILADEEIENGHCLTCQSIPKTKEVMLTFDNV